MLSRIFAVIFLVFASFSSALSAAVVTTEDRFGYTAATGISGLDVSGTSYDVSFDSIVGNTLTSADVVFPTSPTGVAAATAIAAALNSSLADNLAFESGTLGVSYVLIGADTSTSNLSVVQLGISSSGLWYSFAYDFPVPANTSPLPISTFSLSDTAVVPLPAAFPLLLGALGGLGFAARRRKGR
jgi:hypothetical protein